MNGELYLKAVRILTFFYGKEGKLENVRKLIEKVKSFEVESVAINAVLFYSERRDLEKAKKYAELTEKIYKPTSSQCYFELSDISENEEKLLFLLKSYRLVNDVVETLENAINETLNFYELSLKDWDENPKRVWETLAATHRN